MTGRDGGARRGRILWVDDEVDFLEPHVMLLEEGGYQVDTVINGDDALQLGAEPYDLVLLDEQMPGLRGMEVLGRLRRRMGRLPVVMVTKSEEDVTLREAIGRRVDDYIVKPTSPRQVLSVVKRLLEGESLRHAAHRPGLHPPLRRAARDAVRGRDVGRLGPSSTARSSTGSCGSSESGESGLRESLETLVIDVRRAYCDFVAARYPEWVHEEGERGPALSVDVIPQFFLPLLAGGDPALLMVVDCLRLDQWRAIAPMVSDMFEIEETLYASLLPSATPYARNAIFSGHVPDEISPSATRAGGSTATRRATTRSRTSCSRASIGELSGGTVRSPLREGVLGG